MAGGRRDRGGGDGDEGFKGVACNASITGVGGKGGHTLNSKNKVISFFIAYIQIANSPFIWRLLLGLLFHYYQ